MDLNEFISIIASLNGGTVIYKKDDKQSEIVLNSSEVKLYSFENKYYFITEYSNNFDIIEKNLRKLNIFQEDSDIQPHNTYLILVYKITNFTEDISKKIISLEENEFFYKKYVFYYTDSEYKAFQEWFNEVSQKSLSYILNNHDCSPNLNKEHIDFLLRLSIKIPFLHLEFKKMQMKNFDEILNSQLNGVRTNLKEIQDMHDFLLESFSKNLDCDEIASKIFSEIIGGNDNENQ